MCGIAGIVSNKPNFVQLPVLKNMADALQHRGPDGEGFWMNTTDSVGFSHRRLSVIDLSEQAAQPMTKVFALTANNLTITYNGEIYNYLELKKQLHQKGYLFTTQSDTEVLLALYDCYGKACLQYIDGMFAFAIWNETSQELFVARDRFGEKPLYYYQQNNTLFFASEMKALWAVGVEKRIHHSMLLGFLSAGLVSNANNAQETFYSNILKLPAAHCLYYDVALGEIKIDRYWQLSKEQTNFSLSLPDAAEQFTTLLQQSVSRRLRSDVAVGTSLSGGLDSSSIVATINALPKSNFAAKTFSAVFPDFIKDESKYSSLVAQQFAVENFTVTPTANDFADDFAKLLYYQEEPFQSSSIYAQYKVYELAKQHNVTVLLDGQGADEVLAGYTKYYHWFWQELFKAGKFSLLQKERKAAVKNGHIIPFGIKNYAAALLPTLAAQQLSKQLEKKLLNNEWLNKDFVEEYFVKGYYSKPVINNLHCILQYNTTAFGLEDLLRYADRNSMAHGREVRLPFLNQELVEFVFSLPSAYKIQDGFTKFLLRTTMQGKLPNDIVWRTDKIGFEPPQEQWLTAPKMQEQTEAAKQKLITEKILHQRHNNTSVSAKAAHEGDNIAWWILCAGAML